MAAMAAMQQVGARRAWRLDDGLVDAWRLSAQELDGCERTMRWLETESSAASTKVCFDEPAACRSSVSCAVQTDDGMELAAAIAARDEAQEAVASAARLQQQLDSIKPGGPLVPWG